MSVFRLDGVADPAERKRIFQQAHRLTRWSSLFKTLLPSIAGLILAGIAALYEEWNRLGPVFRQNETFARITIFVVIYLGAILLGQLWRLKSERKALKFVLALEQRCTTCGYPMVGLTTASCPECGAARQGAMAGQDPQRADEPEEARP